MTSALLTVVLVINELMASNLGTVMSPATNFDSWIELYNPTETAIELSGMYLSDNSENLKLWQMPTEMGSVPAHGYKVVWLGSNNIKSDQAPFHLNCDGGTIYLSDTEGNMVTSMTYPKAMSRTAYARTSDGGVYLHAVKAHLLALLGRVREILLDLLRPKIDLPFDV